MPPSPFAEGSFVWMRFPFGPPDRPDILGPMRHIAYVLATGGAGSATQVMLAYTSSGRWRGASPQPPPGVLEFDAAGARALNQRPFHIDLRCLARLPLAAAWFPDLATPSQGLVALANARTRDRILKAAEALAARSPRIIEIRGP